MGHKNSAARFNIYRDLWKITRYLNLHVIKVPSCVFIKFISQQWCQKLDLGQAHTECGVVKLVSWCQTLSLVWDSDALAQHKNKLCKQYTKNKYEKQQKTTTTQLQGAD